MKNLSNKIILNIGLDSGTRFTNKLTEKETLELVLNFLNKNNLKHTYKIERSKRENTIIIYLEKVLESNKIAMLSIMTKQDCIACFNIDKNEGILIGRFKDAWAFLIKFFNYFLKSIDKVKKI